MIIDYLTSYYSEDFIILLVFVFHRYYHLVSWGIPLVVACLPFINNHYGPAGAWW